MSSSLRPSGARRWLAAGALAVLLCLALSAQQGAKPAPSKKAPPAKDPAQVALAAAQSALDRKDYATAVTVLENFLFEHPGNPEALFQLAYCYSLQGRTAEAIDLYRETLEAYPKLVPARVNLGLLLLESNQPEAAAAEFKQVVETEPDHARARFLLGVSLERAGKKDEALAHYRRAAELDPALAETRRAVLDQLLEESRWADAQAMVEELLRQEPEDASLLRLRADLLWRQEKRGEALTAYEDYLKKKPDDAETHLLLGRAYRQDGKNDGAAAHLEAAGAAGFQDRAELLVERERWDDAIALYRRALASAPEDAELHASLGYALLKSKRYSDAVPELSEALRLDPNRVETYNHLASALTLAGDWAGALRVLDARARYAEETPGTLFLRGYAHDKLNQCGLAIEYYEKFLAVNQDTRSDLYFQATGRLRLLKNVCRERRR